MLRLLDVIGDQAVSVQFDVCFSDWPFWASTPFLLNSGEQVKTLIRESTLYTSIIILGDPGADSGGEGKSKRAEKYGTKKSKERREEPLGTMPYQTSSKRSPPFCILIG